MTRPTQSDAATLLAAIQADHAQPPEPAAPAPRIFGGHPAPAPLASDYYDDPRGGMVLVGWAVMLLLAAAGIVLIYVLTHLPVTR